MTEREPSFDRPVWLPWFLALFLGTQFVPSQIAMAVSYGYHPVLAVALLPAPLLLLLPWESIGLITAARLARIPLRMVVVPPFAINWSDGGRRLRVETRWLVHGGMHAIRGTSVEEQRRALPTLTWGLLAGGLARVATGLAGFTIFVMQGWPFLIHDFVWTVVFLFPAPPSWSLLWSQLAILKIIRRGGTELERLLAVRALRSRSAGGERPRDWDPALVEIAAAPSDGQGSFIARDGLRLAHEHALDRGDIDDAERRLLEALAVSRTFVDAPRAEVMAGAAFFAARYWRNPSDARDFLSHGRRLPERHTWLRVCAAVLQVDGRYRQARAAAMRGLEALEPSLDPGLARADEDRLRAVIAEVEPLLLRDRAAAAR